MERIVQTPLSKLARQRAAVPGWQRQRSNRDVSELRQSSGDGAAGFAVRTRAEDRYAHPEASNFPSVVFSNFVSDFVSNFVSNFVSDFVSNFVSNFASTLRVIRCSSMSASARNLHPQLMSRIGWYAPHMGYDPGTPPTTPRRPLTGSTCFSISFILRAALR